MDTREPNSQSHIEFYRELLHNKTFLYQAFNSYNDLLMYKIELTVRVEGDNVSIDLEKNDYGVGGSNEPFISKEKSIRGKIKRMIKEKVLVEFSKEEKYKIHEAILLEPKTREWEYYNVY